MLAGPISHLKLSLKKPANDLKPIEDKSGPYRVVVSFVSTFIYLIGDLIQ